MYERAWQTSQSRDERPLGRPTTMRIIMFSAILLRTTLVELRIALCFTLLCRIRSQLAQSVKLVANDVCPLDDPRGQRRPSCSKVVPNFYQPEQSVRGQAKIFFESHFNFILVKSFCKKCYTFLRSEVKDQTI